jgi:CrcB protein
MLKELLLVGLGGGIGSMLRYAAAAIAGPKQFPWITLSINILGSFLMGVVIAWSIKNVNFAANWKPFLAAGLCGGFTTFSAFSAENMALLQNGKMGTAMLYILMSVVAGIASCFWGYSLFSKP